MPVAMLSTALFPGAAGRGNVAMPFPRIAVVNSYGDTAIAGITTSPSTYKRYNLIIANKLTTDPTTLRTAAPNSIILGYINSTQVAVNSATLGVPGTTGLTVYPGWWLTNAGTLLAASCTAGAASITTGVPTAAWPTFPFPILVSSADRSAHEVMVVNGTPSLSGSTYTLTVTRGNWNSAGTAFNAGARVAAVCPVPNFSNVYYVNITPFCVKNGSSQRWSDYLATFIQTQMAAFPGFDGVFLDSSNTYLNPSVNNADADMSNQADPMGIAADQIGGDGPTFGAPVIAAGGATAYVASGRGVYYGINNLLNSLRNLPTNAPKIILTNGSGYPPFTDGMFHENLNTSAFSVPPAFYNQHKLANGLATGGLDSARAPATIFNPCVFTTGAAAATGLNTTYPYSYSYPNMRAGLAIACLTNGFSQYNWFTSFHGQCWVFDEYYKAKGDCLTAAVLTTDTQLTVHDSSKFANGDTIRVPHAVKSTNYPTTYLTRCEDETMVVNGAPPDGTHINVTRSNTVLGTQVSGTAVFTDAQWTAGAGWLGNPKGPAVNNLANIGAALATDDFEAPVVGAGQVVAQTPTGWTFAATANGTPAQSAIFGDATTSVTGSQSAKIITYTPQINNGAFTYFNVSLTKTITTTVTSGNTITVGFWAKASRNQVMSVRTKTTASVNIATQIFFLTNTWTQYWMAFQPGAGDTGFKLIFEYGAEDGSYWLDNLSVYNGDVNIWTRDFDNGLVVFNGSAYPTSDIGHGQSATWKLPALTNNAGQAFTQYQRLSGSQDTTTNSGVTEAPGATPSVAVASLDALFLLKA